MPEIETTKVVTKLQWADFVEASSLGSLAVIWLDRARRGEDGDCWRSNTLPTSGSWKTREEGKVALVKALRQQYLDALASLPEVEAEGAHAS